MCQTWEALECKWELGLLSFWEMWNSSVAVMIRWKPSQRNKERFWWNSGRYVFVRPTVEQQWIVKWQQLWKSSNSRTSWRRKRAWHNKQDSDKNFCYVQRSLAWLEQPHFSTEIEVVTGWIIPKSIPQSLSWFLRFAARQSRKYTTLHFKQTILQLNNLRGEEVRSPPSFVPSATRTFCRLNTSESEVCSSPHTSFSPSEEVRFFSSTWRSVSTTFWMIAPLSWAAIAHVRNIDCAEAISLEKQVVWCDKLIKSRHSCSL